MQPAYNPNAGYPPGMLPQQPYAQGSYAAPQYIQGPPQPLPQPGAGYPVSGGLAYASAFLAGVLRDRIPRASLCRPFRTPRCFDKNNVQAIQRHHKPL